jgi:hypothetical protein
MDGPVRDSKVGERLNDSAGPRAGTRTGGRVVNELPGCGRRWQVADGATANTLQGYLYSFSRRIRRRRTSDGREENGCYATWMRESVWDRRTAGQ